MEPLALFDYLSSKPAAEMSYPFGELWRVYKVKGKVFAIIAERDQPLRINLKCDPTEAQMLRDVFEAVKPGYHMNKRHWNTVLLDGSLPDGEVQRMIDNSYDLVVKGLKRLDREAVYLLLAQQQDQIDA